MTDEKDESVQSVESRAAASAERPAEFFNQLRLLLPVTVSCAVCGSPFEILTGRRGRPLRFCGDTCRRNEQRQQQRASERARAANVRTERSTKMGKRQ